MRSMAIRAEPQPTGETTETSDPAAPGDGHPIGGQPARRGATDRPTGPACTSTTQSTCIVAIFERVGVGPGTTLLDIACGSGLAVRLAAGWGNGLGRRCLSPAPRRGDRRTPDADLRLGSMFELPWLDASFDAAISINGIWGGCQEALNEAFRSRPTRWAPSGARGRRSTSAASSARSPDIHRRAPRVDEAAERHRHTRCRRGDARSGRLRRH